MIFLEKGDFRFENGPKFELNDNGGSVIVGKLDSETREQVGEADIFGDFNAIGYLTKILEFLQPKRTVNIPNFKEMFSSAFNDNVDMCDYCEGLHYDNCIVSEWKEECDNKK